MKRSKRSLQFAGLRPRRLRAYRTALDRLLKYVSRKRLSISKPHRLDRQVAEFIDTSYQEELFRSPFVGTEAFSPSTSSGVTHCKPVLPELAALLCSHSCRASTLGIGGGHDGLGSLARSAQFCAPGSPGL